MPGLIQKIKKRKLLLVYIVLLIIATIIIRVYFFETYLVTQTSMCNTLLDGDKVLVRKRSGDDVARGDIIVYNSGKEAFIKRVAGLPGETIRIHDGKVFIDSAEWAMPGSAIQGSSQGSGNEQFDMMIYDCYGKLWSMNDFGPYVVPKKGQTIKLDPVNILLYRKILETENVIGSSHQTLPLTYTFSKNYLFVLGDNRPVSKDSRVFGVIETAQVIGSTNRVLFSKRSFFNSGRLLKKIS